MASAVLQIKVKAVVKHTKQKPKVSIGCRYEGVHNVKRNRAGVYEEVLPPQSRDAEHLQSAMLYREKPKVRLTRRFIETFMPHLIRD